jgi:hypothetical protein
MYSDSDTVETVGCPIRKSMDQSSFAAPHGLSQRTTSFIASYRQGIHQMPLGHLIALIINAHQFERDGIDVEFLFVYIERLLLFGLPRFALHEAVKRSSRPKAGSANQRRRRR